MQAELATVKDELAVTQQEKQALQMQMVEKERALQATKADLIETRLELQRTESRLEVCPITKPSHLDLESLQTSVYSRSDLDVMLHSVLPSVYTTALAPGSDLFSRLYLCSTNACAVCTHVTTDNLPMVQNCTEAE